MQVRQASLEEALEVLVTISEFDHVETLESLQARLADQPTLVLVAEVNKQLVGVKIGYAKSETEFYSWIGGVSPSGRGHGVAQALLEAQETWVKAQGYQRLTVKSRNRFAAMLRLLLRNGYYIVELEKKGTSLDYRLFFEKIL
ncbi:N-acetyltransferase family protein [Photobacterium kagoshimensis]|uniref:GNAT family N-acetyltransferase n=1 Tax=Photobacterium kagoshimensis TaxID=2910242 RepID=UPI003D0B9133